MITDSAKPPKPKAVPTIHLVMIQVAAGLTFLSGTAYLFAPPEKSDFFKDTALLCLAFLFGKFTNGFGGGKDSVR